jgi:phosphohistidine swiveling domain-containing protein
MGKLIFITESNVPPKVIMAENRFYGYISKEGGVTSHAALVAIGEGKPCVTDVHWEQNKEPGHEDEIIIGSTVLRERRLYHLRCKYWNDLQRGYSNT